MSNIIRLSDLFEVESEAKSSTAIPDLKASPYSCKHCGWTLTFKRCIDAKVCYVCRGDSKSDDELYA